MEIGGTASALLRNKNSTIWSIKPDATVFEAIELMAKQNVGALPVIEGKKLIGIVSERDYTRKVILKGRSSKETPVAEIMSRQPIVVGLEDTVGECMRLMNDNRVRYLPVVAEKELVGILSIGDLLKWIISAQTATIDQLTKYIYGEA